MTTGDIILSRAQRNEIIRAVQAIERQLKETAGKPSWQAAWVISTNLAIIQVNVMNLPRAASN